MKTFHITYIISDDPFLTSGVNIEDKDVHKAVCTFHSRHDLPSIDKIVGIVDKSIFGVKTGQVSNNLKSK